MTTLTREALREAVARAIGSRVGACSRMGEVTGCDTPDGPCECMQDADAALAAIVRAAGVDAQGLRDASEVLVVHDLVGTSDQEAADIRCAALLRALAEAGEART